MRRKSHLINSFSMDDTPENRRVIQALHELAVKDGWSFSEGVKAAIEEYVQRHSPGNPQLVLGHWSMGLPLPQTLRHKHKWEGLYEKATGKYWRSCECGAVQNEGL
jgi:hypothetical protein